MIVIHSERDVTPDKILKRMVRKGRNGQYLWSDIGHHRKCLRYGRCNGSEIPAAVRKEADAQTTWPGYVEWKDWK